MPSRLLITSCSTQSHSHPSQRHTQHHKPRTTNAQNHPTTNPSALTRPWPARLHVVDVATLSEKRRLHQPHPLLHEQNATTHPCLPSLHYTHINPPRPPGSKCSFICRFVSSPTAKHKGPPCVPGTAYATRYSLRIHPPHIHTSSSQHKHGRQRRLHRTMILLPAFPGRDCSDGNAAFVKSLQSNIPNPSALTSLEPSQRSRTSNTSTPPNHTHDALNQPILEHPPHAGFPHILSPFQNCTLSLPIYESTTTSTATVHHLSVHHITQHTAPANPLLLRIAMTAPLKMQPHTYLVRSLL
jgi:hypothetical protein